jgi:hypothetical protein
MKEIDDFTRAIMENTLSPTRKSKKELVDSMLKIQRIIYEKFKDYE